MTNFTYNRGEWIENNSLPEWLDNEDFDDWLKRIEYRGEFYFCEGYAFRDMAQIYKHINKQEWFASICIDSDGGDVYHIFLPDFPSYMMFIKDYAPAITLIGSSSEQADILSIMEKLFLLYHGHSSLECCYECSPDKMESLKRSRERIAALKLERENKGK